MNDLMFFIIIPEEDHRFIKKITNPMLGFKNFKSACSVISGIETFHMLRKNQVGMMTPIQEVGFIHQIMNLTLLYNVVIIKSQDYIFIDITQFINQYIGYIPYGWK